MGSLLDDDDEEDDDSQDDGDDDNEKDLSEFSKYSAALRRTSILIIAQTQLFFAYISRSSYLNCVHRNKKKKGFFE